MTFIIFEASYSQQISSKYFQASDRVSLQVYGTYLYLYMYVYMFITVYTNNSFWEGTNYICIYIYTYLHIYDAHT